MAKIIAPKTSVILAKGTVGSVSTVETVVWAITTVAVVETPVSGNETVTEVAKLISTKTGITGALSTVVRTGAEETISGATLAAGISWDPIGASWASPYTNNVIVCIQLFFELENSYLQNSGPLADGLSFCVEVGRSDISSVIFRADRMGIETDQAVRLKIVVGGEQGGDVEIDR